MTGIIVAIAQQAAGAGKTTFTAHLAAAWAGSSLSACMRSPSAA